MPPPWDKEKDPEWCPNCEEKSARVVWSDDKDWPLTATFVDLDDGESITIRRYCRQCDWGEKRRLTVSVVDNKSADEGSDQSSRPSIEDIFDS